MSLILPCTKYTGICVVVASSYGIQKWMSTWKAWMRLLDEVSERLITLGGAPYASMVEFLEHSNIQEEKGSFERSMEENLGRVLSIFRYLVSLYQKALDITDAEGDDVTNDIFVGAKAELEKHIWMIAAELRSSTRFVI